MQVYVIGGTTKTPGGELPVMLITLASIVGAAMVVGMAWRWHAWVVSWAAFYGIALTAFTGFFTNNGGVWTGLWGTLDYWSRPEADIHTGPVYYYAMLLPVYEFLPLAVAGAGLASGGPRSMGPCGIAGARPAALSWAIPAARPSRRAAAADGDRCGARCWRCG
jgi:hypothetical protein